MKKNIARNLIIFLLIFASSIFLCTCSLQKKPTPQQNAGQKDENKPPEELTKLKENIEKIEKQLESIHEEKKKPIIVENKEQQPQQTNQTDSGGKDSGQGGGSKDGQGGGDQAQQGQQSQQPQPQQGAEKNLTPKQMLQKQEEEEKIKREQEEAKKYESIKKDITTLHSSWNSYEPKAVSAYAQQQTITAFEEALNKLTQVISKKDDTLSLLSTIELTKYLADFYNLYTNEVPPELDKFRYATKRIKLLSEKGDFEGATLTYKYLDNVWTMTKPKLSKEITSDINKFEFALADLKSTIEQKDSMLVDAKCEVFKKVVDDMEKSLKDAKKKEEQSK